MKIISWNVNGLRSVYSKGFIEWFGKEDADIVCLQEIKANENQLVFELTQLEGYHAYFNSAEKKGYSGVAVYTKKKPLSVKITLGLSIFDTEGRILELEYPQFVLMNLYIPNGGRDKSKLIYKLAVYEALSEKLRKIRDKKIILAGDFNIAHREIDLARPKENADNIMFTPLERKQIDELLKNGFVDSFRSFNKEGSNYTWWSYMRNARKRNLGWRIDYIFITKGLLPKLKDAFILKDVKGSDHCPVGVTID